MTKTDVTTPEEWANKLKRLQTEVADIKSRDDHDTPQMRERLSNLIRGIDSAKASYESATEAWREELSERIKNGNVSMERGDGSDIDSFGDGGTSLSPMTEALKSAKFDLKSNPSVNASAFSMFTKSTMPSTDAWPRRQGGFVEMGRDTRFLYPFLPTENAGTDLSIQDFKQTARGITGTVKRAVDATTDKASLDVTLESVVEKIAQFAITINDIPNALFESVRQLSNFLGTEGQFQVNKALDDHVMAQIVAAAPPFGQTGTTLVEKVRNGIATMRATGANPRILVVNPTDAAALDLTADAGGFVFPTSTTGSSSPLWNLRVIERAGAGTEAPYLIDPAMLGVLYLGRVHFDADPYTGFKKNLTTLRVEVNALMHIRNANGARRIAAS